MKCADIQIEFDDIHAQYAAITRYLIEQHLTITTMESMTAGLLASLITDTEGASAVLKGAFVTYSNEAKIRQGVPKEVIDTCGVYSEETARAMARACRESYAADIGIGITGTCGNADPNNRDSVPGQVYAAVDIHGEITAISFGMPRLATRLQYKLYAASKVADMLIASLNIYVIAK